MGFPLIRDKWTQTQWLETKPLLVHCWSEASCYSPCANFGNTPPVESGSHLQLVGNSPLPKSFSHSPFLVSLGKVELGVVSCPSMSLSVRPINPVPLPWSKHNCISNSVHTTLNHNIHPCCLASPTWQVSEVCVPWSCDNLTPTMSPTAL